MKLKWLFLLLVVSAPMDSVGQNSCPLSGNEIDVLLRKAIANEKWKLARALNRCGTAEATHADTKLLDDAINGQDSDARVPGLTGFKTLKFGMSRNDVRRHEYIDESTCKNFSVMWVCSSHQRPRTITAFGYVVNSLDVYGDRDGVTTISLFSKSDVESLLAVVTETFGEADKWISLANPYDDDSYDEEYNAYWKTKNGSSIALSKGLLSRHGLLTGSMTNMMMHPAAPTVIKFQSAKSTEGFESQHAKARAIFSQAPDKNDF